MRILLLAQFFPPDIGGEERHVFNLANTLSERGHQVAVATQRLDGTDDREVLASGVRVHRVATTAMGLPGVYSTSRPHHLPTPDPRCVSALGRIVEQERPDVVHAHNWIVNSALALRRHSTTRPRFGLVLTLHDYSQVCATKRLMRAGSDCEGPTVARCLPCATSHYGPLTGPVTAVATAAMRPWKKHAIDHVVSVSRAVAVGNHVARGPASSVIPNFILTPYYLRALRFSMAKTRVCLAHPRAISSSSLAICRKRGGLRRCSAPMNCWGQRVRACCWLDVAQRTRRCCSLTVLKCIFSGRTVTF